MEKEILFADKLHELRNTAKKQANLVTEEQVQETFAEFNFDKEKLDMVYDYLKKHNIGVGVPVDAEENLSNEERDYLQMYLEDLVTLETVSDGEKEAVILQAMAGETQAQERLITIFLPQVVDVAKLYTGQGVCIEDLIGEGNVALTIGVTLLGAFSNAKEAEGALMKMMMDAMEDYIAENAETEKKDNRMADKVNKVADAARELAEDYGRKVTAEELAAETKLSVKAIKEAIRLSGGKIEDLEDIEEE